MALPVSFLAQTLKDYGNDQTSEPGSYAFPITTITAANAVAQAALWADWFTAVDAISLGVSAKKQVVFSRTTTSGAFATDPLSQRENKWLIRYRSDATFQPFSIEIPCADLTLLTTSSEFLDPASAEYLAIQSAFEAIARSPNDASETVTVTSIQFVGRRL